MVLIYLTLTKFLSRIHRKDNDNRQYDKSNGMAVCIAGYYVTLVVIEDNSLVT